MIKIKIVGTIREIKNQMEEFLAIFPKEIFSVSLSSANPKIQYGEKKKLGRPSKNISTASNYENLVGAVGVEPTVEKTVEGFEPVTFLAPKAAPTPVEPLPEILTPPKKVSKDALTEVFKKLCEKPEGLQTFRTILADFGAKRLGDVAEDKYDAMFEKASSLL